MSKIKHSLQYRPEIDGLRAVAVLPVVFYHVGLGFSGGFVGVDVFFVISGFLITSIILRGLEAGTFTFGNFWERRARRIFPALAVVTAVTLIAGWFLLLPVQYADLGKSAAFMVMLAANIYFYLGTGYFAGESAEKPLLHTWSLAVEEQFYLFLPLLMVMLFRFRAMRTRNALLTIFLVIFSVSLAISVHWVIRHPAAAFYLLPTRTWELLCGSLIAIAPWRIPVKRHKLRGNLCWLGLLAIVASSLLYTDRTPFPGFAALIPCIGTALFLVASERGKSEVGVDTGVSSPFSSVSILSTRPMVFIGCISYSLYLWHWPLVAFANYWSFEPMPVVVRLTIVALSIGLATLSWKYVENPFRTKQLIKSRRGVWGLTGVVAACIALVGGWISGAHGIASRLPPALRSVVPKDPAVDVLYVHNLEASDVRNNQLPPIGVQKPHGLVDIVVWGDSHAMAAMPAFDALCKERNLSGRVATCSSRAPLFDWYGDDHRLSRDFNLAVFDYLKEKKVKDVVLVASWDGYGNQAFPDRLQKSLMGTVKDLIKIGCQPWIMPMVPNQPYDVPKSLALIHVLGKKEIYLSSKPNSWNGLAGEGTEFLDKLKEHGAKVFNSRACFLNPRSGHYKLSQDGHSLYRDRHHISYEGAVRVLLPILRQEFHSETF